MGEADVDWTLELYKAKKVSSIMQSIAAVPLFNGDVEELDFFLKRIDLIVLELQNSSLEDTTIQFILGYMYSRISLKIFQDIGASFDSSWDDVKRLLCEHYGAHNIPKIILREVLIDRENGESALCYAKAVLTGFRKVKSLLKVSIENPEEARGKITVVEELAIEGVTQSLPRRAKRLVRRMEPTSLETLVEMIENKEIMTCGKPGRYWKREI